MGILGMIGGFISSACETIGGAIKTIGSTIAGGAKSFLEKVSVIVKEIPDIKIFVDIVVAVIDVIATILGLKEEHEPVDEIGAKSRVADKKCEDFDSVEEYIKYLREEIKLDREKLKNRTDEEKLVDSVIGATIYAQGVGEKSDIQITPDFLVEIGRRKMCDNEVMAYIEAFKDAGFRKIEMTDYLADRLDDLKMNKAESAMFHAIKKLNPDLNDDEIGGKISEMKSMRS